MTMERWKAIFDSVEMNGLCNFLIGTNTVRQLEAKFKRNQTVEINSNGASIEKWNIGFSSSKLLR